MEILEIILGIVLLVLAIVLIGLVLVQQGKDKKLSGAIAGGSDTFYGKSKGAGKDKLLSVATAIVAVVFVAIVVVMYLVV